MLFPLGRGSSKLFCNEAFIFLHIISAGEKKLVGSVGLEPTTKTL